MGNSTSHVDRIARIKITLDRVNQPIWRRVEVPLTMHLKGVHDVIQAVMLFENYHLFDFHVEVDGQVRRYGVPDPDGFVEISDARNIKLGTLLDRGATNLSYCYDFGDNWEHHLAIEAIGEADPLVGYASRPYASRSTHFDRRIYCRFAVEQHMARSYAAELGLPVPDFHNDTRREVMAAHRELLGRHLVVADLDQLGLVLPKYDWAEHSEFQSLNCVDFIDWLGIASDVMQMSPTADQRALIRARKKRKTLMRLLYSLARPLWPLLSSRSLKPAINFLLSQLATRRAERG